MLGIFDIDYILSFPVERINEWYVYASLRDKRNKENADKDEKLSKAQKAAREGGF